MADHPYVISMAITLHRQTLFFFPAKLDKPNGRQRVRVMVNCFNPCVSRLTSDQT